MSEPKPIYETTSNTGVPETAAPLTCQVCGDEMRFGAMHVCRGVCEWKARENTIFVFYRTTCRPDELQLIREDEWKFCPFCGKSIKVVAP